MSETKRKNNLELLRCAAMMMVIVLHYLDKGNILPDLTGAKIGNAGAVAWLLESFCIVAVNVYMLISGYFLSTASYKLSRLIKLYLQVWVYSVGVGIVAVLTGMLPVQELEIHDLLTMVFPVTMGHYWFITAYVFMYIFLPFMGIVLQKMSKKQMQIGLGTLLFFFCAVKSLLPIRLEKDSLGYDGIWYLCVFVTAVYIRRFGLPVLRKAKTSILLYVGACLAIFALTMGLRMVYLGTGSFGRIIGIGLEYNHLLPYLGAIGLFGVFLHIKAEGKTGTVLGRIASYTLGVYLLHENIGLRYAWQNWLGAERIQSTEISGGNPGSVFALLLWTAIAVAVVFSAGILLEMFRVWVMKTLHGVMMRLGAYRKIVDAVECADEAFASEKIHDLYG